MIRPFLILIMLLAPTGVLAQDLMGVKTHALREPVRTPSVRAQSESGSALVSVELTGVALRGFLEGIARKYGLNMVVASEVQGNVTANVYEVPLLSALDTILESKGYVRREFADGLMVVEPADRSMNEERELVVREFRLRNTDPEDLLTTVRQILSPRGSASVVRAAGVIVVKDIPFAVRRVASVIEKLDKAPRQIMIEARIVEVSSNSTDDLGLVWGADYSHASGNVMGSLGTVDGSFAVNLPGQLSTDTGGAVGFAVVNDRLGLNLRISALELTGEARVVSTPMVQVVENHRAYISEGTEIVAEPAGERTFVMNTLHGDDRVPTTLAARLELSVVPRIVSEGRVALDVKVKQERFDFTMQVGEYPPKEAKSVSTLIVLDESSTVVIGGISSDDNFRYEQRIPVLARVPLLGWFFKGRGSENTRTELLIFLTPSVVKDNVAAAGQSD